MYEIIFFEKNNRSPPEEFLFGLNKAAFSKCLKLLDLLEKYGLAIGMPYVKKLRREIFELRIRGKVEVRFLFSFKKNRLYILHGFKKKKAKIMIKDLNLAKNRLTQI